MENFAVFSANILQNMKNMYAGYLISKKQSHYAPVKQEGALECSIAEYEGNALTLLGMFTVAPLFKSLVIQFSE